MRLSAPARFHGEAVRGFATSVLPCAQRAASSATSASSPARPRRCPLYGAATRAGEATLFRTASTTHAHVTVNEGVTA